MIIHVVAPGETLYLLASTYSTSTQRIISDNGLMYPYNLVVGQALIITQPAEIYTVQAGDTLFTIASSYGITVQELYQNNPELSLEAALYPGQVLTIRFWGEKIRTLAINGYAYPFVDRQLLRRTLPFLTYLSVFSYGIRADGSLLIPDDEEILSYTKTYQTLPVMVLTTIDESGNFVPSTGVKLLSDMAFQNRVLDQVLEVMAQKGYRGLDCDFEYIPGEFATAYVSFLANAKKRLEARGYFLHTALAPKYRADQPGILYEGHDYRQIGAVSDAVLIMTYEWGYAFGPPMAVAPIDQVQAVLQYAVTEIPPEKIFMGIPNYGYNWPLPYRQGVTRAQSLGNQEAIELAVSAGAEILYDPVAQAPYFYYTQDGVEHVVWFEDVRSIQAKFQLLDEFQLRGAGYWNIMRPFNQNWAFLSTQYNIQKLL